MTAPRPTLHGSNVSPFVRKVRVALAFKGLEYENVQQVPFGAPPEFVAKSPLSKIPLWEEGAITSPFVNFGIAGESVDAKRWPQVAAYVQRVHSLPCYAPIVAGDQPQR